MNFDGCCDLNRAKHFDRVAGSDPPNSPLLTSDDPKAVRIGHPDGGSPVFLTCEHAGREIPQNLDGLGVHESELERHIAWDIGAENVARHLSGLLDATLVVQTYSRLVIDCNRALHRQDSIPKVSDNTVIPGNENLHPVEAAARATEIFQPYHRSITNALDHRQRKGRSSVLVAVHSFTPVFNGVERPWHVGILFNRDDRLANILVDLIGEHANLCMGKNEPYAISDETDYTIPVHGERRGIPHIEFEIRQDLITTQKGQREWAGYLGNWLSESLNVLDVLGTGDKTAGHAPPPSVERRK
ncbi:N-formylglutamate amidohydrolase [Gammaproteobacteria bacterium]|nr:N-formylglutamate amidohydrolase [Gammaproteobacteria bacterium]